MSRTKKLPILSALGACGLVVSFVLATGGAAEGLSTMGSSPAAGPARSSSQPAIKGYTLAESEDFIIPVGGQSEGSMTCPSGTVPVGGGGDMAPSVGLSLSTSRPDGSDWDVVANNNLSSPQFFRVFVVCVKAPKSYSVVVHAVNNPAGAVSSSLASCPTGTVALGGGFSSFSSCPAVCANGSCPTAMTAGHPKGWQVLIANDSSASNLAADAVAVCGKKPKGYVVVTGPAVILQAHSDARAIAQCPGKSVPTGGGVMMAANPPQLLEVMNSTLPVDNQWQSFENNAEALADSMTAVTVCARRG